jgi:exosortase D (VPLPA-CTERM-specific)
MNHQDTASESWPAGVAWGAVGVVLIALACMAVIFWDGLTFMVIKWGADEYNHGYLIPFVALYLLWLRAEQIGQTKLSGSWTGFLFVIGGLAAFVLGELSSIYQIIEYGFLVTIFGLIIGTMGWRGFRIVWVPFVYLIFMVPLPGFLYENLSNELQLISSELGVAVIRMFDVSVYLEGNVIDLGVYQLQVAEACSGLRYLFPLMSFGFLCAAIYLGPWWHRVIIFLSGIPLTIFMNSFRIGVIGVLVQKYGIEQAEGFLHYFEGWIVFMVCVGILFLEMWLLAALGGRKLMDVFALDIPPVSSMMHLIPVTARPQLLASTALLIVGVVFAFGLERREVNIPDREKFNTFPLVIDKWRGKDHIISDKAILDSLGADDYLLANYFQEESGGIVSLWVAYYAEQRKGQAVHSPRACLPGGGWQLQSYDQYLLEDVGPMGEDYTVNRSIIAKGDARQLVYYWFVERGRIQTSEYMVKLSIFWDALTMNRTEGALVRVTTFVPDVTMIDQADKRLTDFVRAVDPKLAYYLPQKSATFEAAQASTRP